MPYAPAPWSERAAGGQVPRAAGPGAGPCPVQGVVPRRGCRDASVPPTRVPERRAEGTPRAAGKGVRPSRQGKKGAGVQQR